MKKIRMKGYNKILNYLTFKERFEYTIGEPKSIAKYLIIFDPEESKYYLIDGISGEVLRTTSSLNELINFVHSQSPGLVTLHNIKSNEVPNYNPNFLYFFADEGKFVNLDLHNTFSAKAVSGRLSVSQLPTPPAGYILEGTGSGSDMIYVNPNGRYLPAAHTHSRSEITDFFSAPFWGNIPDKPSTYPPSPHTHGISDITFNGNFIPSTDDSYDIGSPSHRVRRLHAVDIRASNVRVEYLAGLNTVEGMSNIIFNGDLIPSADDSYNIGSPSHRVGRLHAMDIRASDVRVEYLGAVDAKVEELYTVNNIYLSGNVIFKNHWMITAYDENGNVMEGLRILNEDGKEIFKITEDGLYFKGEKIA